MLQVIALQLPVIDKNLTSHFDATTMVLVDFSTLKDLICANLDDASVEIRDLKGTGDHVGILVVSNHFRGLPLLDQHRMVMDILREKLKDELHAVKIKTLTHEKAIATNQTQ